MDKEFESIIKAVKNIKLSENEKAEMRASLFANFASLEKEEYQNETGFRNTRLYYFMTGGYRYKFAPAFMIILIVILTGGTSTFAEKAIPGNFLYVAKILINEPIIEALSLSEEKKVEWQGKLVERRLEEAQKLVSRNSLDENTRIFLEDKIKNQIDEFSVSANELALQKNESTNSSDLNIRLQASLKAYRNVLTTLSDKTDIETNTKKETKKLLATLEKSQNKVRGNHDNLELNMNSSLLAKKTEALNLLNSAKLLYEKEKVNLSINIQNQINYKLAEAETRLEEDKTAVSSIENINEFDESLSAINSINEAKLLMLSNVMKDDIENQMGIKEYGSDIEDSQLENTEEVKVNLSEPELNKTN
ncbi:MAG: hypothetical protein WC870_02825 [Candidatus Paceibacterota bacterium]